MDQRHLRPRSYLKLDRPLLTQTRLAVTSRPACAPGVNFKMTRETGHVTRAGHLPLAPGLRLTTPQEVRGYYIYLEASTGQASKGGKARIESKTITPRQPRQCLTFWYHMQGSQMGILRVYIKTGSGQQLTTPRWIRTGEQGNTWLKALLSIEDNKPYSVVLEAEKNSFTSLGDIAVDDIYLADGFCADITSTASPGVSSAPLAYGATVRSCDFEDDTTICGYTQGSANTFNWQLTTQGTGTVNTGPNSDHTYQTPKGHYVFIDASGVPIGAKAQFISPPYNDAKIGDVCLHFFYFMYGSNVGALNLYVKSVTQSALGQPIWKMTGNQGQRWIQTEVTIRAASFKGAYQIIFEGIRGTNYRADIALDDISFTAGACSNQGDCNFETGLCGWTPQPGQKVGWSSVKARQSLSTPTGDHTLGNSQGTFLFLDSQAAHSAGDVATVISETFPPSPSNGRCLTFWFFLRGNQQATFNVVIRTPGSQTEKVAWSLKNANQYNDWKQARVPIPPSTRDYFIKMVGQYGPDVNSPVGGIGVDDVTFTDSACALYPPEANPPPQTPPTPPASTSAPTGPMNCDFETGLCAWRQDKTESFDWMVNSGTGQTSGTGPIGDHTQQNGGGKYVYVETTLGRATQAGDKARIIGPDTTPGTYCVQFWYQMFGRHVNRLNVYVQTGLVLPKVTWTRQGSLGRNWRYGEVDVKVTRKFNILFEADMGANFEGNIALDDIKLVVGSCTGIPPSLKSSVLKACTFETDLCGFSPDNTDNFDWVKNTGSTRSTGTGPTTDHTLQTDAGHYVYAEASQPHKPGNKARLESPQISATPSGPRCISFWYSMYGRQMGTLNVYIRRSGALGSPVWTRHDDQGQSWKQASVSIQSGSTPFTVVFEAIVGVGYYSDIALDDIIISNTDCSHPADCNFETGGKCTWKNDEKLDNFDWQVTSQTTGSANTGPVADHTRQDATGKYAFIDASSPRKPGDKAWYISQDLSPHASPTCLTFWANMYGATVGTLNVWVRQSSDASLRPVWSVAGAQGKDWFKAQTSIPPQTGSYQVIFEGVRGSSWNGDIAIDDISFKLDTKCAVVPSQATPNFGPITQPPRGGSTTPNPVGTTASGQSSTGVTCNFDRGLCGWSQSLNNDFPWLRHNKPTDSQGTGPPSDHTGGTLIAELGGYYMYIEASNSTTGQKATLISPMVTIQQRGTKCFSMYYYMLGKHVDKLQVFSATATPNGNPGTPTLLWTKQGTQGSKWSRVQLSISSPASLTLLITGTRGIGYQGDIAIDDISLTDGVCKGDGAVSQQNCNFEYPCSYQNEAGTLQNWDLRVGNTMATSGGPLVDHTTSTGNGHYVSVLATNPSRPNTKARYVSAPFLAGTGDFCLVFWYQLFGADVGVLRLRLQDGTSEAVRWSRTGDQGKSWNKAQVPLKIASDQSKVVFEAQMGTGVSGAIALDDIVVRKSPCPVPPECNFDNGDACSWTNVQSVDDFDWTFNKGTTNSTGTGPTKDHTSGSAAAGGYIYIEASSPQKRDDVAYLLSESLQATQGDACLKFWYSMKGSGIGELRLTYVQGRKLPGTLLWQYGRNIGNREWSQATVPITSSTEFQLLFIGVVGTSYAGDIAIDDITLTRQRCPLTPSAALPPGGTTAGPVVATTKAAGSVTSSQTGVNCNFESGICGWSNARSGDDYDWAWGKTASQVLPGSNLVPAVDHTLNSGSGRYLYYNMNQKRSGDYGATAKLISPQLQGSGIQCLSYWYNMASNVRKLEVTIKSGSSTGTPIQRLTGVQSSGWVQTSISFNYRGSYQIVFTGTKGVNGIDGVIGLDDIALSNGQCLRQGSNLCTFETDVCSFTQDQQDDYDWTRDDRGTATLSTGPSVDHTYGTNKGKTHQ
ncbi:MAM and LDL-receptor class A domain-containing protein 1-like [Elysia marginata]|uniref:MAM and LDL-receptor class A domain-containing protein 1-like n=1 Tax=Elysia marginata TaxID=1093978 RepID=A0AAV4FBF3_9GAST|nr:MAM and LDL-receptor class A domain-containing protein 1-like [Elysia marginata]